MTSGQIYFFTSDDFETRYQKFCILLQNILVFKKWLYKFYLQNWFFFFQKDSNDYWHWKLILKVRFRHFLTSRLKFDEYKINKNEFSLKIIRQIHIIFAYFCVFPYFYLNLHVSHQKLFCFDVQNNFRCKTCKFR